MTAQTIHMLAWYVPYDRRTTDLPDDPLLDLGGVNLRDIGHYLHSYSNLGFGWQAAYSLARRGKRFPPVLEGRDLWIWRAYMVLRGRRDPVVEAAVGLKFRTALSTREKLNAILVARNGSPVVASEALGMDINVIDAYEALFNNITDRRVEARFLAEVVYPRGRYVELLDDYYKNEALGTLLMRSGYNSGMADLMYMAGMPGTALDRTASADQSAEKLEASMMANAYMLARLGLLNQGNMPGLSHARQVMQAIKQGGEGANTGNSPLAGAGESIMDELARVKTEEAARQAAMRRDRTKAG